MQPTTIQYILLLPFLILFASRASRAQGFPDVPTFKDLQSCSQVCIAGYNGHQSIWTPSQCVTMKCICTSSKLPQLLYWLQLCVRSAADDVVSGCGKDTDQGPPAEAIIRKGCGAAGFDISDVQSGGAPPKTSTITRETAIETTFVIPTSTLTETSVFTAIEGPTTTVYPQGTTATVRSVPDSAAVSRTTGGLGLHWVLAFLVGFGVPEFMFRHIPNFAKTTVVRTILPTSTATSTPAPSPSPGSGLQSKDVAGIVLGVIGAMLGAVSVYYAAKRHTRSGNNIERVRV
ncbi:hypothetical protein K440DRAFT_641579 [Wilcoxina mikolae CBS 423.85]|nr:hypothetical protein K440DRAFT_641579 [Wilcoxina mikolae CBS 423.85]